LAIADLIFASGVADVIPLMPKWYRVLVQSSWSSLQGKHAIRKARPASAGLIKLLPRPYPNAILATAMENADPSTTIHQGSDGERLKASSIPVITALKSPIVDGFFIILQMIVSTTTAVSTDSAVKYSARNPKNR
jgi:hypothetical protein